jgi:uncharacterized protein
MALAKNAAFFLAIVVPPLAGAQPADPAIDLLWGVKIPMRDGVKLNATVFMPRGMSSPLPVVFTLTPYIADSYYDRASYFAKNGYVFALVDARGRGNSQGSFEPMAHEGQDGYDVVEWLAKQPWSSGKVAMWGGSYAGFDQWSTAKEFPPHLATIVPAAAAAPGVDFPFLKNIFYAYDIQWLTFTSGVTPNEKLFGDAKFWSGKFRELYVKHLPFADLDKLAGNESAVFQKWLEHPAPDSYLDAMVPSADQFRRLNLPILTITGDYDGDQPGAMFYYQSHMENATVEARERHYLIVGPWDHAGTRTPKREVGGLKFGEASMLDLNKLHKEWYDWTMKSGPKPEFLKKRVAYYVVGAEEWKYADSLETLGASATTMYLDSSGTANDAFHSGELRAAKPSGSATDRYTYDPLDTRAGEAEPDDPDLNSFSTQFYALNLFGNGLVYHSEPFPQSTEITGAVRFTAWISMDVPDTDFNVSLYEILGDGSSVFLTTDVMRARYRESLRHEKPVSPGEIVRYQFDAFPWFSRRIARGSRLRLVVQCSNTIQLEKNYNSGGVVARETAKDARTAHVTLYHDAAHASALELPVAHK